ncbi:MAG: hypothetical protein JO062_26265 [Bryobacterales bacterium]|nr:hypothetical protein [Bryobacterales bacterium]
MGKFFALLLIQYRGQILWAFVIGIKKTVGPTPVCICPIMPNKTSANAPMMLLAGRLRHIPACDIVAPMLNAAQEPKAG